MHQHNPPSTAHFPQPQLHHLSTPNFLYKQTDLQRNPYLESTNIRLHSVFQPTQTNQFCLSLHAEPLGRYLDIDHVHLNTSHPTSTPSPPSNPTSLHIPHLSVHSFEQATHLHPASPRQTLRREKQRDRVVEMVVWDLASDGESEACFCWVLLCQRRLGIGRIEVRKEWRLVKDVASYTRKGVV